MARKPTKPATRQASQQTASAEVATAAWNIAAYLRVSTEEQAKTGLGLGAQQARCAAMATVKDWPAPAIYADEGVSGTKDARRRKGLHRLMVDVRAGRIQAVIISSLDRLGRKTRLVLDLVEEMASYGVVLVSCKESLDTATPQGQFVLTLFAALAQLERDLIAERTRAALAEHGRRDGEKGGRIPYGYVRTDRGLRVDRHAADVVRKLFCWHAAGLSLREIAAHANAAGYTTARGTRWAHSSVQTILEQERVYRGARRGESTVRWPNLLDHPDHLEASADG